MNWASRGKYSNFSRTRRARNSNQIEKKKKKYSLLPCTLCRIVMFVIRTQSLVPCQMILQVELAITKKKSTLLTTKNKFQINLQALEAEVAGEFFFYSDY